MAWLIALAAVLISIAAGVVGMFSQNTPLFVGGWIGSFLSILVLMGAVWRMLMAVRRDRARQEADEAPDAWNDD